MARAKIANWHEIWRTEYREVNQALMKRSIEDKSFNYHITPCKHAVKRIVEWLIQDGTPFKIFNLGAGYKKIVVLTAICTECKGKGIVETNKLCPKCKGIGVRR